MAPTRAGGSRKPPEPRKIARIAEGMQLRIIIVPLDVAELCTRGLWAVELVIEALAQGTLLTNSVLVAIRPCVAALEVGQYADALHLPVPSVLRIVHKLAIAGGADISHYETRTGEIQWSSLTKPSP